MIGQETASQLAAAIREIPRGRCSSYGDVGAALDPPLSGWQVGRVLGRMQDSGPEFPWWRVVAKSGTIPIDKKDPRAGLRQRALLESEGIRFADDRVEPEYFVR